MLNLGFNLQKFAYRALQVIPDDARPPAYKVPLWNIGFLVFLGGSLLNLVALKFAAQSLAAPLGGVSLISNAILAPFINNENLTRSDVVAILLILWGTVLVVIFSNHQDKTYTVCELFYLFQRFGTIVYITTLVILLVIVLSFIAKLDRTSRRLRGKLDRFGGITRSLRRAATGFIMSSKAFGARSMDLVPGWIAAKRWKATLSRPSLLGQSYRHALFFSQSRRRRHTEPMPECFSSEYEGFLPRSASHSGIPVPSNARRQHCVSEAFRRFLSGITDGLGGIGSRLECLAFPCLEFQSLEAMKASIAYRYLLPMSYASVGGLLGGMTVLFAKSTAELLTDILEGDLESFRSPYFYVVLVGLLSTGMGQVFFVNQGLERFDALLQMPVYYVVYTMGSVISGGVYFDEFASLTPLQSWMFSLGLCLDLAGVVFLGNRLSRDLNESTPRGGDGSVARSVALDPEDVDEDQVFDDELLSHSRSVEMLCPPDLLEQPLLEEGGDGHLVPRDKYHSISLGVNDRPTSRSLAPFDCPHFVSATSRGASKPRPNLRAGSSPTVSIQNPWLHRRQDPYQAGTPSRPCGGPD